MRMKSLLILLFLLPFIGQGQIDNLENPNIHKSSIRKYLDKLLLDLSLETLEASNSKFYFRLINTRHITEVWESEDGKIDGRIISFIEKLPDSIDLPYLNNKIRKKYFVQTKHLNRNRSSRLYTKIQVLGIEKIPSKLLPQEKVKNIGGYFMEISHQSNYGFKEFWIINDAQLQSENDKKVMKLVDYFNREINYLEIYDKLIDAAPKGCYDLANGFNRCK